MYVCVRQLTVGSKAGQVTYALGVLIVYSWCVDQSKVSLRMANQIRS